MSTTPTPADSDGPDSAGAAPATTPAGAIAVTAPPRPVLVGTVTALQLIRRAAAA